MTYLSEEEIRKQKAEATKEYEAVLGQLEKDYPGVTEGVATAVGSVIGAGGSLAALFYGGSVVGLSAAGITSGLAAAGALVGGGMVAGIGVLAAPVAVLGVTGYALAKKHKNGKLAVALGVAISKLNTIQLRLMDNAEYFKEEIAGIRATIDTLSKKQSS